ncbi:AflYd/sugR/sugar regulator [Colletotrichum nymphaeae SA-01]|uniref:AflYd/sugR/sugar regulator n=1 Tax=Colletotrichum nymphaeae SA-01 TaxID=1460502 RepID=A0A135TTU4_9PEZI|nr:AflYd/sugR/sugar regulator [Colletotrichum nymphaeae SA-01]
MDARFGEYDATYKEAVHPATNAEKDQWNARFFGFHGRGDRKDPDRAPLTSGSPDDHDAWALAGAICATVIAQLRLSQLRLSKQHNLVSDDNSIAESFAHHAQRSHNLSNQHHQSTYYKEDTTEPLLTAFFLHIYFANTERIRLATVYLHEAIAQLHLQSLHRPENLISLAEGQRELLLRIFWLVFVTERTFCVQNCFPPCLKPIQTFPLSGFHIQGVGEVDASFQLLAQLFTLLDDNIVMAADRGGVTPDSSKADNLYSALSAMAKQDFSALAPNLPETQRVNVLMTGNWIHILWWQFALSHYQMSSRMDDAMLSMLKPAKVAHETMRLLGSVSQQAIRTHGYGLKALLLIGGPESLFHKKLMLVMAESQLPVPNVKTLTPMVWQICLAINSCRGPVCSPYPGARPRTVGPRAWIVMTTVPIDRFTADPISKTDAIVLGLKYGLTVANTLVMRSERVDSVPTLAEQIFLKVGRALVSTDYTMTVPSGRKAKPSLPRSISLQPFTSSQRLK